MFIRAEKMFHADRGLPKPCLFLVVLKKKK